MALKCTQTRLYFNCCQNTSELQHNNSNHQLPSTRIKKKRKKSQHANPVSHLSWVTLIFYFLFRMCLYQYVRLFFFFIMKDFAWYQHKYLSILRKISLSFAVMVYYLMNLHAKLLFRFKKMNLRILSLD